MQYSVTFVKFDSPCIVSSKFIVRNFSSMEMNVYVCLIQLKHLIMVTWCNLNAWNTFMLNVSSI
jgi:hypothetical protein